MAENLNQIELAAFTKLAATRQKAVDMAEPEHLPKEDAYSANWLSRELHPDHQYFVISKIKDHGEGVKCFTLVPDKQQKTNHVAYFAAGQYLSVNLSIDGMPVTRAYSISSSPKMALEGEIELTIKQVPGGLVSNWVHENWKVGTKVDTSGPLGTFTYEGLRDAKTVIGIAGGSGITPFLSLARAAPSHCRSGECGWCHSRLVSGEVYMPPSVDGRREADRKFGYIHPCVSFPLTDLTIEIPHVR